MRNLLRVRDYSHSKSTPFEVVIPKSLTGTERKRKYFATREQAEVYILRVLTPDIGYAKADVRGQVVQVNGSKARLLGQCTQEYIESFYPNNKPTFFQMRRCLKPLITRHGRDPIDTVGVQELDALLRSLALKYAPGTQHNYWRRIRQFFIHCHDFGWITSNPMKILKEPHYKKPDRPIVKPRHMRRFLEAAKEDRALTAWLCLGGFAGVRTCEVLAMDWDDLLWDTDEVRVRKAKEVDNADSKEVWMHLDEEDEEDDVEISGDRIVTMEAALRRNLEALALKGAQIDAAEQRRPDGGRGSRKIVPGGKRTLYYLVRDKLRSLGIKEWPKNCLRHSYKSYHIAFHRNLERTRFEMGHGHSNTTKYKYGSIQQKTPAEEWWAL
jgi:integrase